MCAYAISSNRLIPASLPNITGGLVFSGGDNWLNRDGAFANSTTSSGAAYGHANGGAGNFNIQFNARSSNSVYVDGGSVHTKSVALIFCVKY